MKNATVVLFVGLILTLTLFGFPQGNPDTIYYGVVQSEASGVIILNVAPCEKTPNLQTVTPYQKVSVQQASCPDGKPYAKTAVQAIQTPKSPDKKEDKSKAQPDGSKGQPDASKGQPDGGAKEKPVQ